MAAANRLAQLERYLGQDPDNLALLGEVTDLLIESAQWAEAQRRVEHTLQLAPGDQPTAYKLAVIKHHAGDAHAALQILLDLTRAGVDATPVLYELAKVQATLGDLEACAATLGRLRSQVLTADLSGDVNFMLVRVLHRLGKIDEAISVAEQFLQLQPDSPAIQSALATLYLDAQRLGDATRLFERADRAGTLDAEMLSVGGFISLDSAEITVAKARFEQSVKRFPHAGRSWLGLGLSHAAEGDLKAAKQALSKATQEMPTHLGSWHALAWMHLLGQELDAAHNAFNQALSVDRNFGDTHGGLAILAAMRGNRNEAEELIRTARKLDRSSMNAAVAMTLLQHGGSMNSKEFLEDAMRMLHKHALSKDEGMRVSFERLLAKTKR